MDNQKKAIFLLLQVLFYVQYLLPVVTAEVTQRQINAMNELVEKYDVFLYYNDSIQLLPEAVNEDIKIPIDENKNILPSTIVMISNTIVDDYCMNLICDIESVEQIDLEDCQFEGNFSFPIKKLQKLNTFSFSCSGDCLPSDFVDCLVRSPSLKVFSGRLSRRDFSKLALLPNIESVGIWLYDDIMINELSPVFQKIKSLQIRGKTLNKNTAIIISQMTNLVSLDLSYTNTDDMFISTLAPLAPLTLKVLVLFDTEISDCSIDLIMAWNSLDFIVVPFRETSSTKITNQGYKKLEQVKDKTICFDGLILHVPDYEQ